ncbi:tetratricopeptide repeat protein [Maribacter sp.]|uniref:tetratricopeptide repeat protein n=1 Tax=Maribacter sp. TaxID=1897614 RepID=UPI0025BA835E|nr:tetratricopeptide repeat protein [Maribacter sp.]
MKARFLTAILLLFFFLSMGQQKKIDSLELFLNNHHPQDSVKLIALNELIYSYYAINPEKGIRIAETAILLAKKLKDQDKLARAYTYRGHNHSAKGEDSLAITLYDKAIEIHNQENNTKAVAGLIYNKGLVYFNQSNYIKAIENNKKAYEVFKKEKDSLLMAKMLNSIGINQMYLSAYPDAIDSYLEASEIYKNLNLTRDMNYANISNNIGLLYTRLNKLDKSMEYYTKAKELYGEVDFQEGLANTLTNIGSIYKEQGNKMEAIEQFQSALEIMKKNSNERGVANALTNIGGVYADGLEYKKALPYFLQTKTIYEKYKNSNNLIEVHNYLGLCYLNINADYILAESHYQKALAYAEQVKNIEAQFRTLEKISNINAKVGRYKNAYKNKIKAFVMRDSFYSVEKKEEIARIETTYKYRKEKDSLKAIYDQKEVLSKSEIEKEKLIKNVFLLVAFGVFLTAIIGYFLYKRKRDAMEQKSIAEFKTKVAETELKALRSQMNPHFIFNAMNSIGDYMAKNDLETANEYLIKFSKLVRAILENSEKKWISLEEDLELTRLYIEIESLRLKGKIEYAFYIDKNIDIENTMIPPLLLQPFIENSIWHGIAKKKGKGNIKIGYQKQEGMIICSVDDDGVGRKKILNRLSNHTSMGVKITKNRLAILNELKNSKSNVTMIDKEVGLRVEVILPLELRF